MYLHDMDTDGLAAMIGVAKGMYSDTPDRIILPPITPETKTVMTRYQGNLICAAVEDGEVFEAIDVMADIEDVKVFNQKIKGEDGTVTEIPRTVKVSFTDGTSEVAVLSKADEFNLETGITICICKKLLSDVCFDCGGSMYNKIIRRAMKAYERSEKEKAIKKEAVERRAAELAKAEANKKCHSEKESQINNKFAKAISDAIVSAIFNMGAIVSTKDDKED